MSSLPSQFPTEYLHQHVNSHKTKESGFSAAWSNFSSAEKENSTVQRLASYVNAFKSPIKQPFIIGVCGGSASGKTTVCKEIVKALSNKRVAVISQDSFYRNLNEEERALAKNADYDFDHPGMLH